MKLENVQEYVAARIAAVPALAAFGDALLYSHFTDIDAARTAIATQLREVGVCIEVGEVEAERVDDKTIRGVAAIATFEVYVAENPKVAHTPEQKLLRKAVIEAVSAYVDQYTTRAEFHRSDTGKSEQGYVLHILTFTIRVTIP